MINLGHRERKLVEDILRRYAPGIEVRVFGSRTDKNIKTYSDLDIVLLPKKPVDLETMRLLREAFMESELSFRVDVLDWHSLPDSFKEVIEKKNEILLKGG